MSVSFQQTVSKPPAEVRLNLGDQIFYAFLKGGKGSARYSVHDADMTEIKRSMTLSEIRGLERQIEAGEQQKVFAKLHSVFDF